MSGKTILCPIFRDLSGGVHVYQSEVKNKLILEMDCQIGLVLGCQNEECAVLGSQ